MSIIGDSKIVDRNSKDFQLYRNMLPDKYDETHVKEKPIYLPPEKAKGPLNPQSQRDGYKTHLFKIETQDSDTTAKV